MEEYVIYIIYDDDKILYVGKTKNYIQRLKEHLLRGEEYMFYFSSIDLLYFENPFLLSLAELYYINTLKPIYNELDKYEETEEGLLILKDIPIKKKKTISFDVFDDEIQKNIFTKMGKNLYDIKIELISDTAKKLLEKYPDLKDMSLKDQYNFFTTDLDLQKIFIEEYYIPLRKRWYTEKQFKNNLSRFRKLTEAK